MKKSENEDTKVKMEPEVGEKREAPEAEEVEAKRPKTEEVDTNKYPFTPG
jgi:hypothetical protein